MAYQTSAIVDARRSFRAAAFCGAILAGAVLGAAVQPDNSFAATQGILVVVNDQPITSRDVDQRLKLSAALGDTRGTSKQRRKRILSDLINEVIARSEAKKLGLALKEGRLNSAIADMAKGSNTTVDGLTGRLEKKGVSMKTLRSQVEAMLTLRMIIGRTLKTKIEVNDAEVDRRYAKITSDPRLRPVTVYQIREVDLPLGSVSKAMRPQLEYARSIEAQQIAKKYKGCSSLRKAAKGIFNVKIGRLVQAPADKMPKDMKKVLRQAGTKRLIGPMRGPNGIRLIANCGIRTIAPPKPPRAAVKNIILGEKYEKATDRVMRKLRRRALIEYKDKSAVLTQ